MGKLWEKYGENYREIYQKSMGQFLGKRWNQGGAPFFGAKVVELTRLSW